MIYLCSELPQKLDPALMNLLPEERVVKAMKYYREIDRITSVIAYCLFAYGISSEYEINQKISWSKGKHNKPYAANHPEINFNISHCRCSAVCALSKNSIGVDVQDYASVSLDIIHMVCSEREITKINNAAEPVRQMCIFWCLKEAYVKYSGNGIDDNLKNYDFSDGDFGCFEKYGLRFSVFDYNEFCMAVCAEEFFEENDVLEISERDLMSF